MRILIVEDEPSISNFLKEGLEEEGFAVDTADNGKQGLQLALDYLEEYDIILLDWMLPGMSGIEILRNIRKEDPAVPVIFLTARDTTDDAVFGLETGANDYIRKPFAFEELLARIRVLMRTKSSENSVFHYGNISLDVASHRVSKAGKNVELTQKEFALLEFLLRNKGKVSRRTHIIEKVWDIHFDYDTSVIDVYINALRKKLNDKNSESFIETIRGVGYRINDDA
ncbi:MAG: two-component system, OmpR family, copper resistance phosphate regulon response regulator CusR [Anaerophaga sp.]|uniref:response regulator transcription factor n=1 Tax=Anaerophaga thermohalophila TaxID=177400 RepID=UPI000237D029|nr:response regulator transcription factor [Anaerophaga thermohalophila]MDI3521507.1 two-component system, OmpR family, copper resistance phosphate regulon response regulator CusR [Anaerophaga sp.]MDK2843125.1 two-component system, OmpR family, copper resistance phosphate regulon response regulator CusR [Anaerophaga sp.]